MPLYSGFYSTPSKPFAQSRCVNYSPQYAESETIAPARLVPTPGITALADLGGIDGCRGSEVMNGVPYFVIGNDLIRLNRTIDGLGNPVYTTESLGTVAGTDRVSIAENGNQMCIVVPGLIAYVYNVNDDSFVQITDPGFTASGQSEKVVFLDGFFVHFAGKNIFHSEVNDALDYNSLDVGQAEADPDGIVSLFVYKNLLYVLGSETIEVFANVAKFPFSFQRIPGNFQSVGCYALNSTVLFNNTFAFVGGSTNERLRVWQSAGGAPQRISNDAIESRLQDLTPQQQADVFTWSYAEDGGVFLGVQAGDETFVFDATATQLAGRPIWHERQSFRNGTGQFSRYRVSTMVRAYNKILVGDAFSGKIGELDRSTFTEYDNTIQRFVRSAPLYNQGQRVFLGEIELIMNVGTTDDDTLDPMVQLTWSDDTISYAPYRSESIGLQGEYEKRIRFRRLGSAPEYRTFEIRVTDPVDATIINGVMRLDSTQE